MSIVHSTVLCPEKYSERVALMLTVLISRETEKKREREIMKVAQIIQIEKKTKWDLGPSHTERRGRRRGINGDRERKVRWEENQGLLESKNQMRNISKRKEWFTVPLLLAVPTGWGEKKTTDLIIYSPQSHWEAAVCKIVGMKIY